MSTSSTRGVGYTKHLDLTQTREIYESPIQNWDFLYETSTTIPDGYHVGDRVCLPDGRVYRLARATNIISHTAFGLKFWGQTDDGVNYTAPLQTELATSKEITIDAGDSGDHTADEFRGGFIIIHTHTDNHHMTRYILGNTASDADGYITFYVDAPWIKDIEVAYGVEVCPNPYNSVQVRQAQATNAGDTYSSVAGMPLVKTTANNQYLWLQTWGPIWINPTNACGNTVVENRRQVRFNYEGIITGTDGQTATTSILQNAGFMITREDAGSTGPPLVMLQISP